MGRPVELTKKYLMELGVTNITSDGHVFKGDHEISVFVQYKPSRYGTYCNHAFNLYDKDIYKLNYARDKGYRCGTKTIVLSRAIWAWFNDVCPAGLDVDHINNDSLDDRLENYQLLTRKENLAKRKGHMNQYESSRKN